MDRRIFIKNTTLVTAGLSLGLNSPGAVSNKIRNKLPEWKGFNLTDFNTPNPYGN